MSGWAGILLHINRWYATAVLPYLVSCAHFASIDVLQVVQL
jgi:hypothetical protein